jgi:heterodisulfide reductase subunit B/heterodisulfide reductase subunit C
MDLGLKMLSRRKLDLMPSKVKNKQQIQALFKLAKDLS